MRTFLVIGLMLLLSACNKKTAIFNDTRQEDLYLMSGKVFYSKTFKRSISLEAVEKQLKSNNFPNGGVQVNLVETNKLNGVLISYPLDWNSYKGEKISASEEMKKPLNASFEIVKTEQGYKVVVQNMWFSNEWKHVDQENVVLEKYIVDEKRFSFRKDNNTLRIIQHLCQKLDRLFLLTPEIENEKF